MEFKVVKCCKPFPNVRCSSKFRKLTEKVIEILKLMDCKIHLDTSLSICDTCRLDSKKEKTVETECDNDGQPSVSNITEPQPSTSGNDLEEIPSATSIIIIIFSR